MIQDNAPNDRAEPTGDVEQQTFTWDDRHWRVRGLDTQRSSAHLRVNLLVERQNLVHVDVLDLYAARLRTAFIRQAAAELYVDQALIKQDLGRILLQLETLQDQMLAAEPAHDQVPPMSEAERDEALDLLRDPNLLGRIDQDLDALGLAGEPVGRQITYLACVSRLLPRPLAVLIQSSAGAGKTTLQDTVLRLMPPEACVRLSALTGQSLYYMGPDALRHKILVLAEDQGMGSALYAVKLLQSDGRLTLATAEKNRHTGRRRTQQYEVQGPVAVLMTTTNDHPDEELASRCIVLESDERPVQTAAIHRLQRIGYTLRSADDQHQATERRHRNAQRLLEPRPVHIPWAGALTFRTDSIRMRRIHAQYLTLIAASALLHQYQRPSVANAAGPPYVQATLDDLATANRLARAVLAPRREPLLPAPRRLLEQWHTRVAQQAETASTPRSAVEFTQRQLRAELNITDRTLRRHLARLVQLQYVAQRRTAIGHVYRLCDDRLPPVDGRVALELTDPATLDKAAAHLDKATGTDPNARPDGAPPEPTVRPHPDE